MDFIALYRLYNVEELRQEIRDELTPLRFECQTVPELREPFDKLMVKIKKSQRARTDERHRLLRLLENKDLNERKRRQVGRMLGRIKNAYDRVHAEYVYFIYKWERAELEYDKDEEIKKRDLEIHERDKRVSDVYGKNMELDEKVKKLEDRCAKAKKRWWWDAWEPTKQDLEGIKREFVCCVTDLMGMANTVRDWCKDTGVKPEGVNIEGIKNEDLIIWVANECLWKKLPDGMREKICANKDHTMFSWENFKTTRKRLKQTRKRLKQLKKRYVN